MDQITLVLAFMGLNPDHVAATLRGGNVRGLRDCPSLMNPVVRYLKQNIDVPAELEVVADDTKLRVLLHTVVQEVILPQPVTLFLKRFHLGEFPELEV